MFTRAISGVLAATAVAAAVLVTPGVAQAAAPQCTRGTWGGTSVEGYRYVAHPTYNNDLDCVLGLGSASSAVAALQNSLSKCNGQNVAVDGIYGISTRQAVRNVQADYGLTPDGIYGRQTNLIMNWAFNESTNINSAWDCYNPA